MKIEEIPGCMISHCPNCVLWQLYPSKFDSTFVRQSSSISGFQMTSVLPKHLKLVSPDRLILKKKQACDLIKEWRVTSTSKHIRKKKRGQVIELSASFILGPHQWSRTLMFFPLLLVWLDSGIKMRVKMYTFLYQFKNGGGGLSGKSLVCDIWIIGACHGFLRPSAEKKTVI